MTSNRLYGDMVSGLRAVVGAADEFTYAPNVDSVYRQAVEFAREKLGVERCGISIPEDDYLRGTYGTNLRGETTDERTIRFVPNQQWFESLDALQVEGGHYTTIEGIYNDWDGEQLRPVGQGWIVLTPIRSAKNLIGVFFNDGAISGEAPDPNTQEVLSVFCSLLGNMIERKRAESALAEERNLLRTVIDNLPDYIYVKDTQARLVLGNTAIAQLVNDSPESLVGKTNADLFTHDLAAQYTADDQAVMRSGQPLRNREEIALDPAGDPIWLLTSKMPLRNQSGEVTGLVGISRDISELKRSQIALKQSNDDLELRIQERVTELHRVEQTLNDERTLLRTLIDTLPDYIFIKDTEGRFIMSNKAHALAASVLNPEEFRGKPASDFFPPDLASQYDEDDRVVLQTGQSLVNLERVTLDAEHNPIHVSTTKVPLRDVQGNIIGVVGISRDITAFKYAQEALKQQERFLRQVIDANPSLIFVKDNTGTFILVNKADAEMNGMTVEEMVGKRDLDFDIPREEAEGYLRADREVMSSGKPMIIAEETVTSVSTGKQHWLRTIKVPLFDEKGQATQVLGVALDITERKQAEMALQASEERYRTVTDLISDYAFSFGVNPDRTLTPEWGTADSFMRLAGYSPEEIGSTLKLYHPDDAAAVREKLEMVMDGMPSDHECRIITKTGEVRWVHLRRRPVWDEAHERVIRFYGVSQDITARKLVEEALQKAKDELEERVILRTAELSQANKRLTQEITERQQIQEALAAERNLLRTLIDNLPHAVYVKDKQARFVLANQAVAEMMRVKMPQEIVGKIDFDFHPLEAAKKFYADDMRVLETGQPLLNLEENILDGSGQPMWLLTSKLPLWNSRGEVTGLVGIGLDITERKHTEETLRRAHDELEQRVEERTAELRSANEEVRRFAYIVSHDLRAPLVNIKGFSSELRSALDVAQTVITSRLECLEDGQQAKLLQALDVDVPEALGFISASVERMNNLINAILKLSRLGQRELQIDEVNTYDLVQQIRLSLGHQIAERKATIVIGDLPVVSADPTAMEQIFGNILNNAILYLVPERPGRIEISAERLARETVFHIRDNGQGIADGDREKVFELFRRAGKPSAPGEGMGLAYVKALLRRHEGRIWFDSEPGVGTTFSFSIPHRLTQET